MAVEFPEVGFYWATHASLPTRLGSHSIRRTEVDLVGKTQISPGDSLDQPPRATLWELDHHGPQLDDDEADILYNPVWTAKTFEPSSFIPFIYL